MSTDRFPSLGGPSVEWEVIAPHEAQALKNHDQTLKRLAERGGLDVLELYAVLKGIGWKEMKHVDRQVAINEVNRLNDELAMKRDKHVKKLTHKLSRAECAYSNEASRHDKTSAELWNAHQEIERLKKELENR